MTEQEFKDYLENLGYKIYKECIGVNDWYACLKYAGDAPQCFSNEKPVQFVVKFYSHTMGAVKHMSAEMDLCAADQDDQWCELKLYGNSLEQFVQKHEQLQRKLIVAWTALNGECND